MAKCEQTKYTLVEHNGLPNAVMMTSVATEGKVKKILDKGGVVFPSYESAQVGEDKANYGIKDQEIKAESAGLFIASKHDGYRIFTPAKELVALLKANSVPLQAQA